MNAVNGILRLEHDAYLSPMKRQAKIGFQLVRIDLPTALFSRKDADALPSSGPGIGQGGAGAAEQAGRVVIAAGLSDAAARRQADEVITSAERAANRPYQLPGEESSAVTSRGFSCQTDEKFRARYARYNRAWRSIARHPFYPPGDAA
jgi:hypothetical protein